MAGHKVITSHGSYSKLTHVWDIRPDSCPLQTRLHVNHPLVIVIV